MKVSGFTIVCNALKYNYPFLRSIESILPLCDEFVINVGKSEDETLGQVKSLRQKHGDKIRILETQWDFSQGKEVLSCQTNLALRECRGDWAFYLQSDEVIHEADLPRLKQTMARYLGDEHVDALRFRWLHFYGSYYRYRIDYGWYQKQDRIVRNNGRIESTGDAYAFHRKDGQPLRTRKTGCLLYHYGWVHPGDMMQERRLNAQRIGFATLTDRERQWPYQYENLNQFPPYFGSHPDGMRDLVAQHEMSQQDLRDIRRRYWWHPVQIFKVRYKTWKRDRRHIPK